MSYYLRVLCRSDINFPPETVRDFVADGMYFPTDPGIEICPCKVDVTWEISIIYDPAKRPVVISLTDSGTLLTEELKEISDSAASVSPMSARETIVVHLAKVIRIVAIEIDRERLTDEAWEMIDALQAYVAAQFDGLIFAPDDGFFDARLQCVATAGSS